jgi:hypothetical protein
MVNFSCAITDPTIIVSNPLIKYFSEFHCFKVGTFKQIKLGELILKTKSPTPITYSITNLSDSLLSRFVSVAPKDSILTIAHNSMEGTFTLTVKGTIYAVPKQCYENQITLKGFSPTLNDGLP